MDYNFPLQPAGGAPPAYEESPRDFRTPQASLYDTREFPERYATLHMKVSRSTQSVLQARVELVDKIARQKAASYGWIREIGGVIEQINTLLPTASTSYCAVKKASNSPLSSQEDYLSLKSYIDMQKVLLDGLFQQKQSIETAIKHTLTECRAHCESSRKITKTIMDGKTLECVEEICAISKETFTGFCELYQEQIAFFEEEERTLAAIIPQMHQVWKAAEAQMKSLHKIACARDGAFKKFKEWAGWGVTRASIPATWVWNQLPAIPERVYALPVLSTFSARALTAPSSTSSFSSSIQGVPLPLPVTYAPPGTVMGIPLSGSSMRTPSAPVMGILLNGPVKKVVVPGIPLSQPSARGAPLAQPVDFPSLQPVDTAELFAALPTYSASSNNNALASSRVSFKGGSKACVVESA